MAKKKRIAHVVADKEGDMADLMQALGNAGGQDLATTREVNSWISRGHDVSQASKGKKNKRSKRTLLDDCSHPMLTVFYNKDKKEHYVALYDGDRIRTSSENSLDEGQVVPLEDLTALIDAEVLYRFKEMREQRKRIRRKKGKKPVGKEQDKPTIYYLEETE